MPVFGFAGISLKYYWLLAKIMVNRDAVCLLL